MDSTCYRTIGHLPPFVHYVNIAAARPKSFNFKFRLCCYRILALFCILSLELGLAFASQLAINFSHPLCNPLFKRQLCFKPTQSKHTNPRQEFSKPDNVMLRSVIDIQNFKRKHTQHSLSPSITVHQHPGKL